MEAQRFRRAAAALSAPRAIALLSAIQDGGWYLASRAAANAGMHVSTAWTHLSRLHGAGVLERRRVRTATGVGYAYRLPRPSISMTLHVGAAEASPPLLVPSGAAAALSAPRAIALLSAIQDGGWYLTSRAAANAGMHVSTASKHLSRLHGAGVLERRRVRTATGVGYAYRLPRPSISMTLELMAVQLPDSATPRAAEALDRRLIETPPIPETPSQVVAGATGLKAAEPRAHLPQAAETVKAASTAKTPRLCPSCGAALGESDEFCYRCGVGLPKGGDPKIAALMRAFDAILATDSRNLDALFAKGAALAQMERYEEAIRALNEVTRLELRYPGVWFLKTKVYGHLGKPKMAESCRERAIELHGQERLSEVGPRRPPPAPTGAPRTRDRPSTTLVPRRVPARPKKRRLTLREGSTKGLTQPALAPDAQRTAGFTNGARSRPVGLTGGRTNGLVNGRGRTNGLVNGFTSARAAIADGLTNGAGFTNGLGGSRFPRDVRAQRWRLALIPVIAIALLITPVLAPDDLYSPPPITIDGNFTDWPDSSFLAMSANPQLAPDIDVVKLGIMDNRNSLAFYVEVAGAALRGGGTSPGTMDTVRILVDADGSAATGHLIDGLGADRMIEVSGINGVVTYSRIWEFDQARDPRDWGGWGNPRAVPAAVQGSRIEVESGWSLVGSNRTVVSATVRTQSWDGQADVGEAAIGLGRGTLILVQQSQAPTVLSGPDVSLLSIAATAAHEPVTFDSLDVRILGTAPFGSASAIRLLDGTGRALSARLPLSRDVRFTFDPQTISVGSTATYAVVADVSGGTGGTFGVQISPAEAVGTTGAVVTVRESPGSRLLGYVGLVPAGPRVDGGFAEWTALGLDPSGDPGIRGDANVDIRSHGAIVNGLSLYLYADVEGRIFAGTSVPQASQAAPATGTSGTADSDRDTVPNSIDPHPEDFNNDGLADSNTNGDYDGDEIPDYGYPGGTDLWLNTTIPASFPAPYEGKSVSVYIGPTNRPVVLGEDVLRFFLDADNGTLSGYAIGGIGADRMVEVRGKDGDVVLSALLAFAGSYPGDWSWTPVSPVTVATGYAAVELAVSFNASSVYLEAGDFWGGVDTAEPGVARTPAAPGRSFSPPLRHTGRAPDPPRTLDIGGNQKYYLRDTAHATETACGTNKVASTTQGAGPVKTVTLNAGQDACWYLDATTGTTIPAGSWESLLDISPSTYNAKVAAFNIGTGGVGTTVPVTVGFQPKVVLFWSSGRTTSTDSAGTADHQRGFGVAVSTTDRRAICSQSQDNQAAAVTDRAHRDDAATCSMTTGGIIDGLADLSSMDANGFTLIIDDAFATDLRIHYLALGGSSVTNAASGMFAASGTTGNQDVTTVGFQPDAVIIFSSRINADPPGASTDSFMMVGFAVGAGDPNDVVWLGASDDAAATTNTISYHRAGESMAFTGTGLATINDRGEVDAWLSNGFSLNWIEASGTLIRYHFLALKGGNYLVGDLLTLTTSGTIAESGFGFSPKASLFLSHNKAQSTVDVLQDHDELSIGAFSSTADRGAQCLIDEDNVADSDVGTAVEQDEVYCNLDTATAIEGLLGVQSVDSGGFTLVMDDPDPAQSFVGYLAFGANVAYDVYLQIWDKSTDSVRATIGSCLGVTTGGDDIQCLGSSVAQQTIASNEVVRIRVVHSGSVGTVSIDYDDADATGDSRVTIPIPEFEDLVLPMIGTFLVPAAWRWYRRRRRTERWRRSREPAETSSRSFRNRLARIDERLPYDP